MTENESVLSTLQNALDCATDDITRTDLEYAINAVNEIQVYRAIGTVEEFKKLKEKNEDCVIKHLTKECSYNETGCSDCKGKETIRVAVERMKPKKPDYYNFNQNANCPVCKCEVLGMYKSDYCPACGQKIDWN